MSTIINATTTNGVVIQPDNSGSLVLQTNSGTTALTIDTSQNVAFAKGFTVGATAAPAFSAYQSSSQTGISNGSNTKLLFQTEEFDTNNNFASSTFTPTVAGYYQINAACYINATATITNALIQFNKNGVSYKLGGYASLPTGVGETGVSANTLVYCNGTTDYLDVFLFWAGPSGTVSTNATINRTYFNGSMVRSA
jgi:hypothetical protein